MKKISVVVDRTGAWLGISEWGAPVMSPSENWDKDSIRDAIRTLSYFLAQNSIEDDDD